MRIIEGDGVTGLDRVGEAWLVTTEQGRFEAPNVVNCAGAWADRIAAMLGESVHALDSRLDDDGDQRVPPFITPVVGAAGRKLSFKQTSAGTVVMGGGQQGSADAEREWSEVLLDPLARSAEAVIALFPSLRDVVIARTWCGIEAQTPDQSPIIGSSPRAPGFLHAFGYSGHGFQLGPVVGRALAELIVDGSTNLGVGELGPERFNGLQAT